MSKKKLLIGISAAALLIVIVVVVGLISLLRMLPDPSVVTSAVKTSGASPRAAAVGAGQTDTASGSTASLAEAQAPQAPVESKLDPRAVEEQKTRVGNLIAAIGEEPDGDIRVCENLGRVQLSESEVNAQRDFFDMLEKRDDSMNEAFRIPLAKVFKDPNLKSFLQYAKGVEEQSQHLTEEEKKSWLKKAGFYSRVGIVVGQLSLRKAELEHTANQAAELQALAKLTALKPSLAANSDIQALCIEVESEAREGRRSDLKGQRERLAALFKSVGMNSAELGFNPDHEMKYKVRADGLSFSINLGPDVASTQATKQ